MKINEILSEAADPQQRVDAANEIKQILSSKDYDQFNIDEIKKLQQLVRIAGRAKLFFDNDWGSWRKVGDAVDGVVNAYRKNQAASGQMPEFTGRATNSGDLARQIGLQTGGYHRWFSPRTWTSSNGQRHRDPSDHVVYDTEEQYDDALEWLENKAKKVYYRDHFNHLNTAYQIGRYIVEPNSFTANAFSDNPKTMYRLSVRAASALKGNTRTVVDMTDQQAAALKDIADTKNANALEGIKLIMQLFKGQEDVKSIIDNSKKIDPRDKAKLDAIIAGAQGFKEV